MVYLLAARQGGAVTRLRVEVDGDYNEAGGSNLSQATVQSEYV